MANKTLIYWATIMFAVLFGCEGLDIDNTNSDNTQTENPNNGDNQENENISLGVPPNSEIWYLSTDGQIVAPLNTAGFGATILSNTYENGMGIIKFNGPISAIGPQTFAYNSRLKYISLPNSVTTVGELAFYGCPNMRGFEGKFASDDGKCLVVNGCLITNALTGVAEYTTPTNVSTIGEYAFISCATLESITISEGTVYIEDGAFETCANLTHVSIASSVEYIGYGAFFDCYKLKTVNIPSKITTLNNTTFHGCASLSEIEIPNSVTSIGNGVFESCISLNKVTIPDSVTSIGREAFYGCLNMVTINLSNNLRSIGDDAFHGCQNIKTITIPSSVNGLGRQAFCQCSSLKEVYCKATTPPNGELMFDNNVVGRKIYVPTESVGAYKTNMDWKDYANDIVGYDFD